MYSAKVISAFDMFGASKAVQRAYSRLLSQIMCMCKQTFD
jgi:hypothetical protein